jgi:hypothetical protein
VFLEPEEKNDLLWSSVSGSTHIARRETASLRQVLSEKGWSEIAVLLLRSRRRAWLTRTAKTVGSERHHHACCSRLLGCHPILQDSETAVQQPMHCFGVVVNDRRLRARKPLNPEPISRLEVQLVVILQIEMNVEQQSRRSRNVQREFDVLRRFVELHAQDRIAALDAPEDIEGDVSC